MLLADLTSYKSITAGIELLWKQFVASKLTTPQRLFITLYYIFVLFPRRQKTPGKLLFN